VRAARVPNSVVIESRTEEQVIARVRPIGTAVAPTVTLYLTDEEWTCDCGSPVDPCAHIATVAVAVHQGLATSTDTEARVAPVGAERPENDPLVRAEKRLGYCLWTDPQGLTLSRVLVGADGSLVPLKTSLHNPAARTLMRELMPREQDLALDRLIGGAFGRYRLGPTQAAVMAALAGAANIQLDAKPIAVSTDAILPCVRVIDAKGGVDLLIERPPELDRTVGTGLGLADGTLRPLGETEISGLRWEKLPNVRHFTPEQYGELVTRVLPQLQRRMLVNIESQRLPGLTRRVLPSVTFDIRSEDETLVVIAKLVYGIPPLARVENDRLVQLGPSAPRRDIAAEQALRLRVREDLDLLIDRPFHLQGVDAARFSHRLMQWQRQHGLETTDLPAHKVVELRLDLSYEDQALQMRFVADTEAGSPPTVGIDASTVLRAFDEGLEQVPLQNGAWGRLPVDWLKTNAEQLRDLLVARSSTGALAPAARVALADFCRSEQTALPSSLAPYAALLAEGLPEAPLPNDCTAQLRPYQRHGVDWLHAVKTASLGAILADDMGLGKTVQALSVIEGKTLVVCPRSVMHNWVKEANRFRPSLRTNVYHGSERQLAPEAELTITTYALLRLDTEELKTVHFGTVILDEAQAIKNPSSQAAEAACSLRSDFRLVLTGTPIENRLEELYSLMHFANPGLLGTLAQFKSRFADPIASGSIEATARLRKLIAPFVMRRHKQDVLVELPPRTDSITWVELDETERQIYDRLANQARTIARDTAAGEAGYFAVLEALLRLRQTACHLGLLPDRNDEGSSKVEALVDMLEEIIDEGHRALVFSQWTSLLSKLEPALRAKRIDFARLDGKTRDRQAVVDTFQSDAGAPVLLASLQAGGTGLNLTGADHVFLIDPWWNPAVEEQAASRAHRMGQTRPVFVHRLVAKDTVEEKIMALQHRKRELGTLVDSSDPTTGLSRDELFELIA
jgi:superfamily II DNA or RNA helicase